MDDQRFVASQRNVFEQRVIARPCCISENEFGFDTTFAVTEVRLEIKVFRVGGFGGDFNWSTQHFNLFGKME
jgi:hypothetical protein